MRRIGYTSTLIAFWGLTGCAGAAQRQFVAGVKNKPALDFELTALDGSKVRLNDQRGKPVVLAFFAYG